MKNRRLWLRVAAGVLLVLLIILLYNTGKAHQVLPDNKTMTLAGIEYAPLAGVEVSVDGQPFKSLAANGRMISRVKGRHHKIELRYRDASGQEQTLVQKFLTPHREDIYLLSLPALAGESSEWVQPFHVGETD